MRALRDALWYVDGHFHTLREATLPLNLANFSEYNRPELSKHRKRLASNMEYQSLKGHASSGFLLTSWMKRESWKLMKEDILSFASSLEGYAVHVATKRQKHTEALAGGSSASVGDSMHFQTLPVTENCPSHLKPLVDELSGQDYYTSVFIHYFAPSNRTERFY